MQLHLRIVVLLTVMRLSAEEQKRLKGSVGGNITLPEPVMEAGFLNYGPNTVAMVNKGELDIVEDIFRNKIHWNKNSGLFTITNLQKNDSGVYTVDSKKGRVFTSSYKLTVFDPVPGPAVSTVSVSSDSCTLRCSVDTEATLCWYRDQEVLNRSSHAVSLPLTVLRKDFSSSYQCVASNPAENKTAQVHMETSCRDLQLVSSGAHTSSWLFLVPMILCFSATAVWIIVSDVKRDRKRQQLGQLCARKHSALTCFQLQSLF